MKKTLLFIGLGLLTLASCKKKGCTDENAANYDVTAEKDDETCEYNATGVFYYDQDTYLATLVTPPINELSYYIDGVLIGTIGSDNSWTDSGLPDCSSTGLMQFTVSMGAQKQKLHNYEVRNAATDAVVFSGSMVFVGGTCHAVELTN
ncbi:MAG: hypothetical protein MI810_08125 [Flavobacteriales bacterium]|nr:hypothetical protein [Flavobacteriales bacterium]